MSQWVSGVSGHTQWVNLSEIESKVFFFFCKSHMIKSSYQVCSLILVHIFICLNNICFTRVSSERMNHGQGIASNLQPWKCTREDGSTAKSVAVEVLTYFSCKLA